MTSTVLSSVVTSKKWSKKKALSVAMALTLSMMVLEFVYSVITGSLMLYSDAIHMLSHAASLGVSYFAVIFAGKKVSDKYPFGLKKLESLTAFVNGIGLGMFSLYICYEGIMRIIDPIPISSTESWYVAFGGLVVNLMTAFVLSKAGLEDLNTKSAFLHMLADTFSSVAIMIGLFVIEKTGWYETDGVLSLVVAVVIAKWAWNLTIDAGKILIGIQPEAISSENIKTRLQAAYPMVTDIISLKVWTLNEKEHCATLKVRIEGEDDTMKLNKRKELTAFLSNEFQLHDVVIQYE